MSALRTGAVQLSSRGVLPGDDDDDDDDDLPVCRQVQHTCRDVVFYLETAAKLLVNINSCVNFVIYCLLSPKFRRRLVEAVTCQPSSSTGGGGGGTVYGRRGRASSARHDMV